MSNADTGISLLVCGEAGQGIQTVETLLTKIIGGSGYNVYATKEYMSRVRGGSNSTEIRIAPGRARAPVKLVDICALLDKDALKHVTPRLSPSTVIIADEGIIEGSGRKAISLSFSGEAESLGSRIYGNIIAAGVLLGIIGLDRPIAVKGVEDFFSSKSADIVERNVKAIKKGYELAVSLIKSKEIPEEKFSLPESPDLSRSEILCNGAKAIGLGALAGGCNFISSYPMSPSTGVLTFFSEQVARLDIIAEQAEDEISAINMAIGAWYAGGRGIVTTSGGGFALMEEGISLAGMLEVPIVVHLAQRPGPATGLPTRTEQGDLELALYSGHGEFPRAIFAPGSVEEAYSLTQRAFYIADRYQVPSIILTDQYLMDSYYNCPVFATPDKNFENHIVKTGRDYKRYRLTKDGISPRGIPGYGDGLVLVDSDEHDERGRITEDMPVRVKMVEKRLKKLEPITREAVAPTMTGDADYSTIVVSWGSTFHIVEEAMARINRRRVSHLHFSQVYPLHKDAAGYLKRAKKVVVVENNATAQFGRLLKLSTGLEPGAKVLKYDGLPFFADELAGELEKVLQKGDRYDG